MKFIRAVLALPFMVSCVIPGMILYFSAFKLSGPGDWQTYIALLLLAGGIFLAAWTIALFKNIGQGTLAPWDPPVKIVVTGPYRYVRNPMLSGIFLILLSESIYFQSAGILVWLTIFTVINMIYLPLAEEPGLRKRFCSEYEEYCRNVPRYIPRLTPWKCGKTEEK